MKNEIQKYEPMKQITMKDGRVFIFPSAKYDLFIEKTKIDLLVNVEGVDINKYEIKYIEDLPKDYDILAGQPQSVRTELLNQLKAYEATMGKKPSRSIALRKLERILSKNI